MDDVRKQGIQFNEDDSPSDTYYGYLSEIERVQYKEGGPVVHSVQLEIVPYEWMEAAVMNLGDRVRALPPTAPVTLLAFDEAPLDEVAEALGTTAEEIAEGDWYILTVPSKGGIAAKRTRPVFGSTVVPVKALGRRVTGSKLVKLSDATSRSDASMWRSSSRCCWRCSRARSASWMSGRPPAT